MPRVAFAIGLALVASIPGRPAAVLGPVADALDLGLGYSGDDMGAPRGYRDPLAPVARWRIIDPRLLDDGRLALTVEVTAPAIDLPVQSGPAVLFGAVELHGDAGGDVGLGASVRRIVRVPIDACRDAATCVYRARVVLPTDRAAAIAHRPIEGRWGSVHVGLMLVRTFDQGRWFQVMPLDGYSSPTRGSQLGAPEPWEGSSPAYGLFTAAQAARWRDTDSLYGSPDPRHILASTDRLRRRAGDTTTPAMTTPLMLDLRPVDCQRGFSLATDQGDVVYDTFDSEPVSVRLDVPTGTSWTLTVPNIDSIEIPDEDPLGTFGPFTVEKAPVRIRGTWDCSGSLVGDVVSAPCGEACGPPASVEPAPSPPSTPGTMASPTMTPAPIGPSGIMGPPDPPVGRPWREVVSERVEAERMLDVVSWRNGFVALGRTRPSPTAQRSDLGVPTIRFSSDGEVWQRVLHPFPGVRAPRSSIARIVVFMDHLVAIGHDRDRLMVWESTDGHAWHRQADRRAFAVGGRAGALLAIRGVAADADRLVVLGDLPDGVSATTRRAWTTTDGRTWARARPVGLGGDGTDGITAGVEGFIGIRCCEDADRGVSWLVTSVDGIRWESVAQLPARTIAVAADPATRRYFAAQSRPLPDGLEAATLWTSADGIDWTMLVQLQPTAFARAGLAVFGPTLVMTGLRWDGDQEQFWWAAAISDDAGQTWEVSAGWPGMTHPTCGVHLGLGVARIAAVSDCFWPSITTTER